MADVLREIEQLEQAEDNFRLDSRRESLDQMVADEMARVRKENTRSGISLASEEQYAAYEAKYRQELDAQLTVRAITVDSQRRILGEENEKKIAASETLPPLSSTLGTTTEKHLLARLLEEMEYQRIRDDFVGLTRSQLSDLYEKTPDTDVTLIRAIESAFLDSRMDRFDLAADNATDAIATMKLQDTIKARRKQRVPQALLDVRARLQRSDSLELSFKKQHLRDGKGIAVRPTPLVMQGAF